jgi:Dual-action HEIGH metallo-peptidase
MFGPWGHTDSVPEREKDMISRATVLALSSLAFAFGCADQPSDTQEIVDNLVQAGFPTNDIQVVDGAVYVGRDAQVSLEASREMLETDGSSAEQYRTNNLVSSSKTKICVNPSSAFTGNFSTGLNNALANYTNLSLTFDMVRGPTSGCSANISAVIQAGLVGGSSGFPSGGNPYGQIIIGGGLSAYSVDVIEHVITHELGHTIGFRHSDYYNRAISCGSGGNEGSAGIGAVLVPGTPGTAVVGGSIMNSCFRSTENGEFTSSDLTALNYLY